MSFDWGDYLGLAQELAGHPVAPVGPEARLRSALSRAYYAAFQVARQDLRQRGNYVPPRGANEHEYVRVLFAQDADPTRKKISADLDRLRTQRNDADYDDVVPNLANKAQTALALARRVLNALGHR